MRRHLRRLPGHGRGLPSKDHILATGGTLVGPWRTPHRARSDRSGAGEENRTPPFCLGSKGATTTLRPRCDSPNVASDSPTFSPNSVQNVAFPQHSPQPFATCRYVAKPSIVLYSLAIQRTAGLQPSLATCLGS